MASIAKAPSVIMVLIPNYQIPRPISTMPITSHPTTPTEMIVSSVTPESDGLGFGFESESADFIDERQRSLVAEQMDAEI